MINIHHFVCFLIAILLPVVFGTSQHPNVCIVPHDVKAGTLNVKWVKKLAKVLFSFLLKIGHISKDH